MYRRGFPDVAFMTPAALVRHGRAVCRAVPVTGIGVIGHLTGEEALALLTGLGRRKVWEWLQHLGLVVETGGYADLDMLQLITRPACRRLARVTVRVGGLQLGQVEAIQQAAPATVRLKWASGVMGSRSVMP